MAAHPPRPAQVQYLYSEGDLHYFMDKDTYEQFPLSPLQLGDAVNYLKDGMELEVLMYDDEPVGVDMPLNVVLEVRHTEPGYKGDTATGGNKQAEPRNGLTINVPAVRQHGRQDSRRHARRLVHRACVTDDALLALTEASSPARWPSSRGPTCRARPVVRRRPAHPAAALAAPAAPPTTTVSAQDAPTLAIVSPLVGVFHTR